MARNISPRCKICRRTGDKLFLKGNRCASDKCAFEKRPFPPGQKSKMRRSKLSNYGIQLREKQRVRKSYGILEKQFKLYFKKAEQKKGVTGTNLLRLLELRLDNIIFRLGFALSRNNARQLVRHSFFSVNGKKVNIPSYLVKEGDVIEIRNNEKREKVIKDNIELTQSRENVEWLEVDEKILKGIVKRVPEREDISEAIQEHFIIELYSK
jgi:small subunit ribosomal protein S4